MDYSRTMNKIIFDKYLEDYNELSDPMYPKQLIIPTTTIKPVPYYGMIPVERAKGAKLMWMTEWNKVNYDNAKDFTETFKDFCFSSLYIKEEVIAAL